MMSKACENLLCPSNFHDSLLVPVTFHFDYSPNRIHMNYSISPPNFLGLCRFDSEFLCLILKKNQNTVPWIAALNDSVLNVNFLSSGGSENARFLIELSLSLFSSWFKFLSSSKSGRGTITCFTISFSDAGIRNLRNPGTSIGSNN